MKKVLFLLVLSLPAGSCSKGPGQAEHVSASSDTYEEAFIYGFPMIVAYQAMYQLNVDKTSSQYKVPFNQIWSETHDFTPKDTAITTPNLDETYSLLQVDVRAEPIVICVPKIEKSRYYSVQFTDMYSFNYGYVGSRTTGNGGGCYLIAGPSWRGEAPPGIKKVFRCETQFGLVTFRTQLFNRDDIVTVRQIQAGYAAEPLSAFVHTAAPPWAQELDFPVFTKNALSLEFPKYLNFLLQFCPVVPEEAALRSKFAAVGIEAGSAFDFSKLPGGEQTKLELGVTRGYEAIARQRENMGKIINGWNATEAFGDRAYYHGRYLLRAAAALMGIYGNSSEEAIYIVAQKSSDGNALDGSKQKYTLTFAAGQFPPVNGFWSVTVYDGRSQLLVANPIKRYRLDSHAVPSMRENKDGSLTMYFQKEPPSPHRRPNWLPVPDGPFYAVMRLYWPKQSGPSILPAGYGGWNPPEVRVSQ